MRESEQQQQQQQQQAGPPLPCGVFSSASQSVESRARVRFAVGLERLYRSRLHVLWCVGVRAVCSTTATEDKLHNSRLSRNRLLLLSCTVGIVCLCSQELCATVTTLPGSSDK